MTYLPPSKTGLGWSFMLPSFSKASRICVSLVIRLFRSPQKLRGRERTIISRWVIYHILYHYICIIAIQWTEIHWNYSLDILDMEAFHYLRRPKATHYPMWNMLLSPLDQEPCQAPLAQPRSFTPQPQSNLHFQLGLGQGAVRFTKFWSRSGGPQPKFKAGRCNAGARQSLFSRLLLTHRKVRNAAGILNWTWGIWWVIWGKTWSVEMASNALPQHTLS